MDRGRGRYRGGTAGGPSRGGATRGGHMGPRGNAPPSGQTPNPNHNPNAPSMSHRGGAGAGAGAGGHWRGRGASSMHSTRGRGGGPGSGPGQDGMRRSYSNASMSSRTSGPMHNIMPNAPAPLNPAGMLQNPGAGSPGPAPMMNSPMNAGGRYNARQNRASPYGNRPQPNRMNQGAMNARESKLAISNYPAGTTSDELLSFIRSKSPNFEYIDWNFGETNTVVEVTSQFTQALKGLSGIFFKNHKLSIQFYNAARHPGEYFRALDPNSKQSLMQYVMSHFNPAIKYLDLDRLSASIPGADFLNKAFVQDLLALIEQCCPDLATLNFNNNQIVTLSTLSALPRSAKQLRNISLSGNPLTSLREFESFRSYRTQLREIILTNTPAAATLHPSLYHYELRNMFPGLELVDGIPVQKTLLNFFIPDAITSGKVPDSAGSCFSPPEIEPQVSSFINSYFSSYDSNRQNLLDSYSSKAQFSLTVEDFTPPGSRFNPMLAPTAYKDLNRNLLKLSHRSEETAPRRLLLKQSKMDIIMLLQSLPRTHHDSSSLTADAFYIQTRGQQVLQVSLRGVFMEPDAHVGRNFNRVFLLGPQENVSWPFAILHDMLHIGSSFVMEIAQLSAASPSILSSPAPYQPPAPQSLSFAFSLGAASSAPSSSSNPQTEQQIMSLAAQTNVAPQLAKEALERANFNFDSAAAMLIQFKQQ